MNLTIDQYILGLEGAAERLPSVLTEWNALEPDTREECASRLEWLIEVQGEVLSAANTEGRFFPIAQRIAIANSALLIHRFALEALMGLPTRLILGCAGIAANDNAYRPPHTALAA